MPCLATPLSLPHGAVLGVTGVGSVPTGGKSLCQGESSQLAALSILCALVVSQAGNESECIKEAPLACQASLILGSQIEDLTVFWRESPIKMFPGPKGKWQAMAHIWVEEISITKLAVMKSPWLCCPLGHVRVENASKYLWKFYELQSVYNSKPVLEPFSLLILIYPGFEVKIKEFYWSLFFQSLFVYSSVFLG